MAKPLFSAGDTVRVDRSQVSGGQYLASAIFFNPGRIIAATGNRYLVEFAVVSKPLWFDDCALIRSQEA